MEFKITSRMPDAAENDAASWHDLPDMRREMTALSGVLDALVPGQSVTITRVS